MVTESKFWSVAGAISKQANRRLCAPAPLREIVKIATKKPASFLKPEPAVGIRAFL